MYSAHVSEYPFMRNTNRPVAFGYISKVKMVFSVEYSKKSVFNRILIFRPPTWEPEHHFGDNVILAEYKQRCCKVGILE